MNLSPPSPTPARRSGLPLHRQISEWIADGIRSGSLVAHEQLPSENALGRQFEVSRLTVRRALQTLEGERLIYRRQGLGSFVADRRVPQGLVRLTDFAQDMERAGLQASSRILHRAREPARPPVAGWLEVTPGTEVLRLDRLRLGDGEPIALDRTWLPPLHTRLLEGHDLTTDTIYGVLEREFGIPVHSGRYRLTSIRAAPDVADALSVSRGEALLLIERLSRMANGQPMYFQHRFYRSDRVAYELEVARGEGDPPPAGGDPAMPLREFEAVFRPSKPEPISEEAEGADGS